MIRFKIYDTVAQLPKTWDNLVTHDIFLQTSFLKALEVSCPKNITPYYVGFLNSENEQEEDLVGVAIMQRVELYLDDVFRKTSENGLKRFGKAVVSKIVRGNALVVGNLMHTGQHGIYFDAEKTNQTQFLAEVFNALEVLSKQIKDQHGKTIRIVAFKDYFDTDAIHDSVAIFEKNNLYKVQVQPNMILSIASEWQSISDYTFSLNKKYKRRFKTARKKLHPIETRELTLDEIEAFSEDMFRLYRTISDKARINSFVLDKNHFFSLKKELGDQFKVFGYFLEDALVGFFTLITNNSPLETYFLGYDEGLQAHHQMYLNMLYDMASFAIKNKLKTVVYARTAMEIKSSVGAKPHQMHIYMKHTNNFIANRVLKFIVKSLNPVNAWQERHPFK